MPPGRFNKDKKVSDGERFKNPEERVKQTLGLEEKLEQSMGFVAFTEEPRLGWLMNMSSGSILDEESGKMYSCANLYFMCQDGSTFKAQVKHEPYFYIATKNMDAEVEGFLRRKYEETISSIEIVEKEDLSLKNHLAGLRKTYLKLNFLNVKDLMFVKSDLASTVSRNKKKSEAVQTYADIHLNAKEENERRIDDFMDAITDMREFDVPYHVRFAIDKDFRCGYWYDVYLENGEVRIRRNKDLLRWAEPKICAFDIETTKLPLKFPDAAFDVIMMISYMLDGQGYLIINREIVSEDIQDLEYSPKPEFPGPFKVTNVENELSLLQHWFNHMREARPGIFVTYNGDFFDFPFIEKRAEFHGLSIYKEIGFQCDSSGEYRSRFLCHLDCFAWVKRDSYLPQGSQGLKAVTKAKLGYDPLEVNPEDMVKFAIEKPQIMASYSVSDAVATYYLYTTYVHPFIFSLSTIIPMPPDEVLRKGSGTLCEMLLMDMAFKENIICPNKHTESIEKSYKGKVLENETYIGGHVECLESGVFRSDIKTKFHLIPKAYQHLIDKLDDDLVFCLSEEGKMSKDDVTNFEEIKEQITSKLESLRDNPSVEDFPLIYHLDVAAMYPNIMLTNRLQPPSIVTDDICAACDFNLPDKKCLRKMEWVWRGETYSAKKSEYIHLRNQLESEKFPDSEGNYTKFFFNLPREEQKAKLKERLKKYCQKVYKRVLDKPNTEVREAGVCQRENPFYIDTVRNFRDRRYEYKGLTKVWKNKLTEEKVSENPIKIQEAKDMVTLYDSLQLAHKCILNSFYGYVMRKGARWYSMEMAGITTYTGAKIIQNARKLIEQIGKPLELDTDGIWCCLPSSFPENFTFIPKDPKKKKVFISYPCAMLNADVKKNNTNDQYQTLVNGDKKIYEISSECSIAFEIDGPYKAMILPASKSEDVLIKKRYAVFNHDGTLSELKGFEMKRRGELKLIKIFQAEVFESFLHGSGLKECYDAVAAVANRWLDMLNNEGIDLIDSELLEYISESSTMSKSLEDYGNRKSCAMTTAKRLSDFLGEEMVKDKGLACQYIISKFPLGLPVSERAIPVTIFNTEKEVMQSFLRKWCKESNVSELRSIVDWEYYKTRLSGAIQKIITIPAAMQKIENPVPRVAHPEWLWKRIREKDDKYQQKRIEDIFLKMNTAGNDDVNGNDANVDVKDMDIEDWGKSSNSVYSEGKNDAVMISGKERIAEKKSNVLSTKRQNEKGKNIVEDDNHEVCIGESSRMSMNDKPDIVGGTNGTIEKSGEESVIPDKNVDYKQWLAFQKRKWKQKREDRKRKNLEFEPSHLMSKSTKRQKHFPNSDTNGNTTSNSKNDKGMRSFFFSIQSALLNSDWQIIQISPNPTPGEFSLWILVNHELYCLNLLVERKIYINSKIMPEEIVGEKVNRVLPHNHLAFNLFQVTVKEEDFKKNFRHFNLYLADPDIEGIYESKMNLEIQALMDIGCVCAFVNKNKKENKLPQNILLSDLTMKPSYDYLTDFGSNLSYIFLYHSFTSNKGVYTVYDPKFNEINIIILNPFTNRDVTIPNLERFFKEIGKDNEEVESENIPKIHFKIDYFPTASDCFIQIQKLLLEYKEKQKNPTMICIESKNRNEILASVPILKQFPCIPVPHSEQDNQYPSLAWQAFASKICIKRCLISQKWILEKIHLSRFSNIPIGNFEADWILFISDIFFARTLHDKQNLLWYSENGFPDIGGKIINESSFLDEVQKTEVIFPGAFRSFCVEIEMFHLALNSILKSSLIDEVEGGSLFAMSSTHLEERNNNIHGNDDEVAICQNAFFILRNIVSNWFDLAIRSKNDYSDLLLQHLYRWISSPLSKLHDPCIHRVVNKIMQKTFVHLLAEMKKLGVKIIFANFSKIIFATGKKSLSSAKAYCDFILNSIHSRDLFTNLELKPSKFWQSLIFMDLFNYGGISVPVSTESVEFQSNSHVSQTNNDSEPNGNHSQENSDENSMVESCWNIAEFLPKAIQDHFIIMVSEFLYLPWKYFQKHPKTGTHTNETSTSSSHSSNEALENEYLKTQLKDYFTPKLLRLSRELLLRENLFRTDQNTISENFRFPDLAGSHSDYSSPAVEFVKFVSAVFQLDENLEHEVMIMRKQAFKLIKVREFSSEAKFVPPCITFVLPNVICSHCNDCQDLDLCRDMQLLKKNWVCKNPSCFQPYNMEWIENALIQIVSQRNRNYQLQDLKCKKCRQIKANHMAAQCNCGGEFECMESPQQFLKDTKVFYKIAQYYDFQLLKEVMDWVFQMIKE